MAFDSDSRDGLDGRLAVRIHAFCSSCCRDFMQGADINILQELKFVLDI